MYQEPLDELDGRLDRLIAAYSAAKEENRQLRDQLLAMEGHRQMLRSRLDNLIAKLEGVDNP
jgi:cell division septum initiation protein DivIVA